MGVRVKICGVRSPEMADVAVRAGADFLGFNFVPDSPRYVEPARALEIIESLKNQVRLVGVFRDAPIKTVNDIAARLGLDFVQLHGNEDRGYVDQIDLPVIKAVRVGDKPVEAMLADMRSGDASYFLLDREVQGHGEGIDLDKARVMAREFPVFVAGGLDAGNVGRTVRETGPYAVDVAGGIETDGGPDMGKIRAFIKAVKQAGQ